MKNTITPLKLNNYRLILSFYLLFVACSINLNAQKLQSSKDEFTGVEIKETTWERLIFDFKTNMVGNSKIISKDGHLALMIAMHGQVFGVDEGSELIFKFEDESILTVKSIKVTLPTIGGGAIGVSGSGGNGVTPIYGLSQDDLIILSKKVPTKIRVYTIDAHIDMSIKGKNAKKLIKQAQLLL